MRVGSVALGIGVVQQRRGAKAFQGRRTARRNDLREGSFDITPSLRSTAVAGHSDESGNGQNNAQPGLSGDCRSLNSRSARAVLVRVSRGTLGRPPAVGPRARPYHRTAASASGPGRQRPACRGQSVLAMSQPDTKQEQGRTTG